MEPENHPPENRPPRNHSTGQTPAPCRLFIGTSGYAYGEWIEAGFYPAGTRAGTMLDHYAQTFGAIELNYTWYQMPKARAMEQMSLRVPEKFQFSIKLTRTLTHEVKQDLWIKEALLFRQGIAPLEAAGKLLCILIQLPPYFTRTLNRRTYLAALLDELAGLPLAVEFRHDSWVHDKVFSELEHRHVTLVAVDEPDLPSLFPKLKLVTNPALFYLRFHGRNCRGWQSRDMQQQFDYDYTDLELAPWVTSLETQMMPRAEKGAIFFNNHVRAQAPKNACRFISLLSKS